MRTTLTFNSNLESLSDYMIRVIAIFRTIRHNVPAVEGIDYSVELSEDGKLKLYQRAMIHVVEKWNAQQESMILDRMRKILSVILRL